MNILNSLKQGVNTHDAKMTMAIAKDFGHVIPEDQVIALHGDLGAGKTTFVKGLAQAWGIDDEVTSPTFNIYTIYKGRRNLLHLDAYRLSNEAEIENLLLEEFLLSPYCMVVEWPEKIESILPKDTWHLYFKVQSNRSHSIKLEIPQ